MRPLLLLALLVSPLLARAEAKPAVTAGSTAFTAGINGSPTVGGAYFLSPTASLRAAVGFDLDFKPVDASFSIGVGYRHHFSANAFRPFFQPGVSFGYANLVDVSLSAGLGVEYFVTPRVSLAAMASAALRFANGGNRVDLGLGTTGLQVAFIL